LTAQDASALTRQQQFEEEELRRAKKEEKNSCKPSKKRRFLGNQHTKSTPKPKGKPPPAAATLKKRCCPVEQDSSEKNLDNVSKVLDMESELEGVVGLLVGEESLQVQEGRVVRLKQRKRGPKAGLKLQRRSNPGTRLFRQQ
jgi:hypothetical protein